MFLVFNKQKVYAYIVSVFTVFTLFVSAIVFQNNSNIQVVRTASTGEKLLPIYNVQTNEKKVAFTMNCAWNADDIDIILKTLKENDIKITFFMVGDWIEKYRRSSKENIRRRS